MACEELCFAYAVFVAYLLDVEVAEAVVVEDVEWFAVLCFGVCFVENGEVCAFAEAAEEHLYTALVDVAVGAVFAECDVSAGVCYGGFVVVDVPLELLL